MRFNSQFFLLGMTGLTAMALSGCGSAMSADPRPQREVVEKLREKGAAGTGGAATVAASTGTGWGHLKGVFKLAGTAPTPTKLSVEKDLQVSGRHPIFDQGLVVDSASGGIANVLVFARKVSREFPEFKDAAPTETLFDQKDCVFLSHVFVMRKRDTMKIKNSDPVGHNTNMSPAGNPQLNQLIAPNDSITYNFAQQLSAPAEAACTIHPWMRSYVMCRDDAYFALTKPDGSFEIKNLPAGEPITFQVWHERASGGLKAKGDWAQGRFTVTIPENGEMDLKTIDVPLTAFK